ncbi:MAG: VPLPA-CTERM sorting domain-containing protein [Pseudomonadota bacterium]
MKRLFKICAAAALVAIASTAAHATTFIYDLDDHPDGGESGSFDYGVRLDNVTSSPRFFTFDPTLGSSAQLTYDDVALSATLTGTVYESTGVGTVGNPYILNYRLDGVTDLGGGFFEQRTVQSGGTLTFGSEIITLGTAASSGIFFKFANDGHRLPGSTGIAGRGWVKSGPGANDFLFTASNPVTIIPDPVPLPAAGWMLLAGIGGIGLMRRRRKQS